MTYHMKVSIEGVLRWPDKDLMHMFADENGHQPSACLVRDFLKLELAKGHRVLPVGKPCEGWNYETGCPGHAPETELSAIVEKHLPEGL